MKFYTVPRHYILTTEGYVLAEEIAKDPSKHVIKSYVFDKREINNQDIFTVSKVEYGYPNKFEYLVSDKALLVRGFKLFRDCLNMIPVEDVLVYTTQGLKPYQDVQIGDTIVTCLKHMIIELKIEKYCKAFPKHVIYIELIDLPSITISIDEAGTMAMTFFNAKYFKED